MSGRPARVSVACRALCVGVCALGSVLALTATAPARTSSTPAPSLNQVASRIAGQPLEVRCWLNDGNDIDADPDAWGYVWLYNPVVYMSPQACEGALALQSGAMQPLWELALGALVLTHESYHLKTVLPDWRRGDEAQTECRAIKRVPSTLLELGATQALADAVLPWALAEHFKISTFDRYDYPNCKVPGFGWWG